MIKNKPEAVLISDVHYSLPTLELADNAMRQAIAKANELQVPLIVAGDLHDTKANLRGECVNRMLLTFRLVETPCYIIRGNHDQINEKSKENSLNFLRYLPNIDVVDTPYRDTIPGLTLLPYYSDPEELREVLSMIKSGSTIIMHQGIEGSNSGDYIQDKSAILPRDVNCFRVISGHYHTRQTIQAKGMAFPWDYIGNPYTLNYGEANDPPKGFQILMDDDSLEFVPTNLRKHVIVELVPGGAIYGQMPVKGDLAWVKAKGPRHWLNALNRSSVQFFANVESFKLTLEPTDLNIQAPTKQLTHIELFDNLIDSTDNTPETKDRLKSTWKSLCES